MIWLLLCVQSAWLWRSVGASFWSELLHPRTQYVPYYNTATPDVAPVDVGLGGVDTTIMYDKAVQCAMRGIEEERGLTSE